MEYTHVVKGSTQNLIKIISLNPYFIGIYSRSPFSSNQSEENAIVLILILLEYTHVVQQRVTKGDPYVSLNPYFIGIYSRSDFRS